MWLVLIGPPGSGKGTQSVRLSRKFHIPHLSTGEILRDAKANETPLGKIVGPVMDAGGLVSDSLMIDVVRERINQPDCHHGFLLDGFPRSLPQADSLCNLLSEQQRQLNAVIELRADRAELERRLINRFHEVENPRPEDQPEAIGKRLDLYEEITKPLLAFYADQRLLMSVDGMGTPEAVFERILLGLAGRPV